MCCRSISAWAEASARGVPCRLGAEVYLRVGGVIRAERIAPPTRSGLSPRGRSHQAVPIKIRSTRRSISAWAESSAPWPVRCAFVRVYLRVGGVITPRRHVATTSRGLSPRGRSHLQIRLCLLQLAGSISAWAESSQKMRFLTTWPRVYLRVGGVILRLTKTCVCFWGLSPRGRSHHTEGRKKERTEGSISAWAESSPRWLPPDRAARVYLRVGGVIR